MSIPITSTTATVARSVGLLMFDQGKTQVELAALLTCSRNRASKITAGRAPLTYDEVYTVARWLGTTSDQLAEGFKIEPVARAA